MEGNNQKETIMLNRILGVFRKDRFATWYSVAFRSKPAFTEFISEVIGEVAAEMGLHHYREYYTIDHVLYEDEDVVTDSLLPFCTSRVSGTWLRHIRVAIEHENSLDVGGGFQELAKLMLVNADLKVLMGYAERGENYDDYARDYHHIFITAESAALATPILFIGEYVDHVEAYLISVGGLMKYQFDESAWRCMT